MSNPLTPTIPQECFRIRLFAHDGATSDAIAVFTKIRNLTFSALRTVQSDEILDTMAVVRGYAEVWIKNPEVFSVRQRMADALVELADLLECAGDNLGAKQARWCALFACSRDIQSGRVIQPTNLDFRI